MGEQLRVCGVSINSDLIVPFGKYKGQPVEVMAADVSYCEWLTGQKWFRGKYRDLYRALKNPGAEPGATPPVPVLVGLTGNPLPETAEFWPPWEHPPVPGCLAESGITVTGLVWCPVHQEYEELRDGLPDRAVERMRA